MALFGFLLFAFAVVSFFLPWFNRARISEMENELSEIRMKIRELDRRLSQPMSATSPQPISQPVPEHKPEHRPAAPMPPPAQPMTEWQQALPGEDYEEGPLVIETLTPTLPKTEKQEQNTFELNFGTKLPVWVGAISLICAVFYLVKYSIAAGWLNFTPLGRVGLGIAFGAALVIGGQWTARREWIANSVRIAQGLVGAGLVALYFSLYAAVSLYGLLPPVMGVVAMGSVTALAVILSLRHGHPIAVFGLIGGLLTPALIGSHEPHTLGLFAYLLLLFSGMMLVTSRRGWWNLACLAIAGVFAWAILWLSVAFIAGDASIVVLFAIAVCGVVLAATASLVRDSAARAPAPAVHNLNMMGVMGGVVILFLLQGHIALSLFDWSMLGLLSLACIALAWFRPGVYHPMLLVKLAADLLMLWLWAHGTPLHSSLPVVAGLAAVYVALPYFVAPRAAGDPRPWIIVQVAAAVALYLVSYYRIPLPPEFAAHHVWGISSLALATAAVWQAHIIRKGWTPEKLIGEHMVALYALAATSFISIGMAIELPESYLPLAFAAQIAATLWIMGSSRTASLDRIVQILTIVFIALNWRYIVLFTVVAFESLVGAAEGSVANAAVLASPQIKLALPALFTALALWLQRQEENPEERFSRILFACTLGLGLAYGYFLTRHAFHGDFNFFHSPAGFVERSAVTLLVAAVGLGLAVFSEMTGSDFMKDWGRGLAHLAAARIIYFDLLMFNPYLHSSQNVGILPILNGVTLTYGTGIALALALLYRFGSREENIMIIYKAFGFICMFLLTTLNVRQLFHGAVLAGGVTTNAEFYSYSIVWLLAGLALLAFGIANESKTARIASLVFMLLTVAKVFLLDAAQLEGLYRVASFLGLGVSLIGLSYFYTRFVFRTESGKQSPG